MQSEVGKFILNELSFGETEDAARNASQLFGLPRAGVNELLREMERMGLVRSDGNSRRRFHQMVGTKLDEVFVLSRIDEHRVWKEYVLPHLSGLRENVVSIASYVIQELVNNAIDSVTTRHSAFAAIWIRFAD